MKKLFSLLIAVMVATSAFAQTIFSTNITVNTAIPDNNPSGLASSFNLAGFGGIISNITVSVDISGGYNGDLFAYLTGPGGYAVLMNRAGVSGLNPDGYGNTGFAVTFMSLGADIHGYGAGSFSTNGAGQLTGTWGVDGRAISPFSAGTVFDSAARTALLDSFIGTTPNGTWSLFIGDYSSGDISTLASFNVTLTVVPEPTTLALLAVSSLALLTVRKKSA